MRVHRSRGARSAPKEIPGESVKGSAGIFKAEPLTDSDRLPWKSVSKSIPVEAVRGVGARLAAFVVERVPFAVPAVMDALEACGGSRLGNRDAAAIEALRPALRTALTRRLAADPAIELPNPTPGVGAEQRRAAAREELIDACDGFLSREAIAASLSADERREILRGMILTRAVDNRLKQFFTSGEVLSGTTPFQGKGFRSLGQEA